MPKAMYDGVELEVSESRMWPIDWINFRMHPCTDWSGVEKYRNGALVAEPIILCKDCLVVLDGWHRLANAWQQGKRYIGVRFADFHLGGAPDECHVAKVNWAFTLRPWVELPCASGSYLYSDFQVPCMATEVSALRRAGDVNMPMMRWWEHAMATLHLGLVVNRRILDVGTRESILPGYLADKGARVTAIDLGTNQIYTHPGVEIQKADARDLPFDSNTFDHVISTACIKHIPEGGDTLAVSEMLRVVKPHGLVAVSFDFGQEYAEFPSEATGRRIYDAKGVYERLVEPLADVARLIEPADFDRSDWSDWPIEAQAPTVYERGFNVQVAFVLLRKRG